MDEGFSPCKEIPVAKVMASQRIAWVAGILVFSAHTCP